MEKMGREEIVAKYRPDMELMVNFLPWLEGKTGEDVTTPFETEDGKKTTLPFPVYNEILLEFLNTLGGTVFMNPNYRYVYAKYRISDYKDEIKLLEKADIMKMDIIDAILSRYVLGGMTKAYLWTDGIEHQIFWKALMKAKEIVEFWSVPIPMPVYEEEETAQEVVEEFAEVIPEEIVEEVPVEETPEVVAQEVAVEEAEAVEEPVAEEAEETTEEPAAEEAEETTEEAANEEAEETTEEPAAEEVEETTEEPAVEETEEPAIEDAEETTEEPANEEVEETTEEPAVEEGTEE